MRVMSKAVVLACVFAVSVTGALAGKRDPHGAAALEAGDLVTAEAVLSAERASQRVTPETLLNLARVYRHTGRMEAARALYEQVLADPDVLLDVGAARPLPSHEVARNGLARLGASTVVATR